MAEMPQGQEQAAPEQEASGGGVADAFVEVDKKLATLVKVAAQADQVPDEAKQAFGAALEAWRQGLQILMQAAGGGGGGPAAPEAGGAAGAVPESPAGVQR